MTGPISNEPTAAAALAARDEVERGARLAGGGEHAAARFAQAAVFEEALLAALRARFAELRIVAK